MCIPLIHAEKKTPRPEQLLRVTGCLMRVQSEDAESPTTRIARVYWRSHCAVPAIPLQSTLHGIVAVWEAGCVFEPPFRQSLLSLLAWICFLVKRVPYRSVQNLITVVNSVQGAKPC